MQSTVWTFKPRLQHRMWDGILQLHNKCTTAILPQRKKTEQLVTPKNHSSEWTKNWTSHSLWMWKVDPARVEECIAWNRSLRVKLEWQIWSSYTISPQWLERRLKETKQSGQIMPNDCLVGSCSLAHPKSVIGSTPQAIANWIASSNWICRVLAMTSFLYSLHT